MGFFIFGVWMFKDVRMFILYGVRVLISYGVRVCIFIITCLWILFPRRVCEKWILHDAMYVNPLLHFLRLRCILLSQSTFLASKPYMTKNVKGRKKSKKKKISFVSLLYHKMYLLYLSPS